MNKNRRNKQGMYYKTTGTMPHKFLNLNNVLRTYCKFCLKLQNLNKKLGGVTNKQNAAILFKGSYMFPSQNSLFYFFDFFNRHLIL